MASNAARVVATAKDFDKVGLGIIGYYLQLYAVELILSEEDRSQEMTALATELLDTIEAFKKEIGGESEAEDSDKSLHVMNTLIHDQEKAKIYMLNFTMSLYNEKLKQLKDGPWDVMLKRSLWCCIDLFSCILHLWKENISETSTNSLQKRIKYCKIYLSKLAKGEIGSSDEKTLDYADFADDSEETKDEDVDHQTSDLENNNNDKVEGLVPKDQTTSYEPVDEVPEFIDDADSVNEEEQTVDKNEDAITKDEQQVVKKEVDLTRPSAPSEPAAAEHKSYTKDELTKIMDRASKIEQIQKLAKYAISALNYEDLPTAKDELTKALDLLNSI
ncbi:BAQ_1a_G0036570.mRNA.1.CDS.1 [Saccharomyces cerevisiae]|nr:BAQ_1a_G0036570.mRNA.1.CDS.1 [Saccharomyces cerevisiae]CAI4647939.1 BAM_G0036550.mRNA.1.CDS.1 [Saccharomyces cerevisiae]CAI7232230.1 BAM_G0036550.mRNA.1.CDS.1 [Saccharomyces cerevisiae]CAI7233235.1 BAQ_1a_G0036570.mRNA.1.CDS.1 [Saccharomyces cerevisiae]